MSTRCFVYVANVSSRMCLLSNSFCRDSVWYDIKDRSWSAEFLVASWANGCWVSLGFCFGRVCVQLWTPILLETSAIFGEILWCPKLCYVLDVIVVCILWWIVISVVHVWRSYYYYAASLSLEAERAIGVVIKLSRGRSVGQSVCRGVRWSVCPVHCGKTADRIRMPFAIIGRQDAADGGVWRSVHGKGYFWARISVQDRITMED